MGGGGGGGEVGEGWPGAAVHRGRVGVTDTVPVGVTVTVRVVVGVVVGVAVSGISVSVAVFVTVGVKSGVAVRVKTGLVVGVLVSFELKFRERKPSRPLKPAQMNKITGMATSSQASPSNSEGLMIELRLRMDLGKPSRQACMKPGHALWPACRQVLRW